MPRPTPASGGARQQSPKILILKIGGAFWLKSELFLPKIRTANSEIQSLGAAKRKGVGGKEFLPAFPPQFFVFRFAKCAARIGVVFAPPSRAHTTDLLPLIFTKNIFCSIIIVVLISIFILYHNNTTINNLCQNKIIHSQKI